MNAGFVARAFGSRAGRRLARYRDAAEKTIALASDHETLTPTALRDRVRDCRRQSARGVALDDLAVSMFALVREAARRTLHQPHVTAQLTGGFALQDGCIVEMKTGEGKTLVATLVCALNALSGRGVHVATPNDYLAGRDARWMQPVYEALGLSVGLITQDMDDDTRRRAYACDITYGVASEFGFDYLRDNMKFTAAEMVQRGHAFALVDEADFTLIDEASMPLALFGPLCDQSELYQAVDAIVARLEADDYDIDGRRRITLTDRGYDSVQRMLRDATLLNRSVSLHHVEAVSLLHHVMQALRARILLARDRDYIVQDGQIVIVDSLTGRLMHGRRYDDGLHQALEAKETCAIGEETRTLASMTFQAFFRQYDKLAGMTGTATGDEDEFRLAYGLDVIAIPPHRPVIRRDDSVLHATRDDKMRAILQDLEAARARNQPVLIGVPSIEHSDGMARLLEANGWRQGKNRGGKTFSVLDARHHADEAHIIARAGLPGAVTIATALAGRGTDIRLGASRDDLAREVRAAGGLLVIGVEHHDHSRLDAQLRGRAGRQGDPGRSVFHASLQDDLVGGADAVGIVCRNVDPSIAKQLVRAAQKRHENEAFNRRVGLLRFDDVIQQQRQTLYRERNAIRDEPDALALTRNLRNDTIEDLLKRFAPSPEHWDLAALDATIRTILTLAIPIPTPSRRQPSDVNRLRDDIVKAADLWMEGKIRSIGHDRLNDILRRLMMALIDQLWAEQTERLDHLKRTINDRGLTPSRALVEFQREAFILYEVMTREFRHELTAHAMRLGVDQA